MLQHPQLLRALALMRLNRRVPVSAHGGVRGRFLFKKASYSISFFSGVSSGASFGRVLLLATGMNRLANLFSPRLHT